MVTISKAVSPWLRWLAVALAVLIALSFAEHILIVLIGSAKPNPQTGQIYNVSLGIYGFSHKYVGLWLFIFDSLVMTALSLVILALIARRMILGRDQKGSPREAKRISRDGKGPVPL